MELKQRLGQYGMLGILALIWGSSFILMKKGLVYFDSSEVAALRMSVAMLVLLPIALRSLPTIRTHPVALFSAGLIGSTIPAFLFAFAQTEISSSLSGMLNSSTSLFTLVLGVAFFRTPPLRNQIAGVLLALAGTIGLIGPRHLLELSTHGRYSLLVLAATCCYGVSLNLIKVYLVDVRPPQIVALSFLLTAPFLVVYLLLFTDVLTQLVMQPDSLWGLAYVSLLGVLGTSVAVILFNRLIQETTAVFASSVTYLIPVVALGWGIADGEPFAAGQMLYLLLILGGIFLINARSFGRRAKLG